MQEIKAQLDRIEDKLDRLLHEERVVEIPKCKTCGGIGYQGGDHCSGIIFNGIHDIPMEKR